MSQFVLLLFLLAGIWLHQGCSAAPPHEPGPTRIVCGLCEETDRFVRLQSHPNRPGGEASGRFAHPFRLSSEDWIPVLASIQVQTRAAALVFFSTKQPAAPAFSPAEVEYLSVTLSKAFAEAGPEEWVVFGLSQPGASGITEMTTGGWFLEGSNLHLVLANHRCPVSMPGVRDLLARDPLTPNTGRAFDLAVGPHQQVVKDAETLASLFGPTPWELAIDYRAVLLASVAPSEGPAKVRDEGGEPQAGGSKKLSIEESLALLKRLRDQGLITDADYDVKKKQLLDRF
jgi:hypothetical protein